MKKQIRKKISIEKYIKAGEIFKSLNELIDIIFETCDDEAKKEFCKGYNNIMKSKSRMEDLMFLDYPNEDKANIYVYYGNNRND